MISNYDEENVRIAADRLMTVSIHVAELADWYATGSSAATRELRDAVRALREALGVNHGV